MCSGEPEKSCQLSFRALQKRKSTKKEAPKKAHSTGRLALLRGHFRCSRLLGPIN